MKRVVEDGTFASKVLVPEILSVSVRSPDVVSTTWYWADTMRGRCPECILSGACPRCDARVTNYSEETR